MGEGVRGVSVSSVASSAEYGRFLNKKTPLSVLVAQLVNSIRSSLF